MSRDIRARSSTALSIVFDLLNPVPFGFFVGALIFDVVYARSADAMWSKSAAWLISVGLFFAVIPRFINLFRVWFPDSGQHTTHSKAAFLLYLAGVAVAIANAFVHSRDAYAIVPEGVLLSALTVALLAIGNIFVTLQHAGNDHRGRT